MKKTYPNVNCGSEAMYLRGCRCDECRIAHRIHAREKLMNKGPALREIETLQSALSAEREKNKKLREALKLIVSSIEAANVEGLQEAIRDTTDAILRDLLTRRVFWHFEEVRAALASDEGEG